MPQFLSATTASASGENVTSTTVISSHSRSKSIHHHHVDEEEEDEREETSSDDGDLRGEYPDKNGYPMPLKIGALERTVSRTPKENFSDQVGKVHLTESLIWSVGLSECLNRQQQTI